MSVAIVTGGSRGIGRAIARRLGARGASVVVNYQSNRSAAEHVAGAIESSGGQALTVRADVADAAGPRRLFDAAEERFGGVDIFVNNAGSARFGSIAEATDEDFELMFAVNTKATFVALREAANRLRDNGRIVVVSSGATLTHRPGSGVFGASKAAVEQLVRVLAGELAPRGITANSVLPGAVRTDALAAARGIGSMREIVQSIPLGRLGEPDDIADVVDFLASDAARWITGASVPAGGGAF
ncbi:glucose 1-dehydrogenase [Nocardia sp. NPDC047654]|uniref:glucose 1-dehydrogenase n=1 Tax=Nocardia sp. NPDC047654 TaxID=3364314 RepID=UPI0037242B23